MDDRSIELKENMEGAREAVAEAAKKAGRSPDEIRIVAVSKIKPASDIRALFMTGHRTFGESYAQEARDKMNELSELDIDWHFIGGLQSNKAKYVAGRCELVHSVDSAKLAQALHKKASALNTVQKCLIQVNISGETQKSGIAEQDLHSLTEELEGLNGIQVVGLMTMPPFHDNPEAARPIFSRLRDLRDRLVTELGRPLPELSMGMTGDFAHAVAEGATLVRIGTRIFGKRPKKA